MFSFFFAMMFASLGPMGPDTPAREPKIAANSSLTAMTFGAGHSIYCSISRDGGKTFGVPVKVAEAPVLALHHHRGPHIAFSGKSIVISAVTGQTVSQQQHAHGLPSDGNLMVWRSIDNGKSWSREIMVNDEPGAPTEGLHSLAADAKGTVFAAWLDKRSGAGTELYGARSKDGGATWSKNVIIYHSPEGSICQCCSPSAAIDASGQILVMWRNWLNGNRDMYLARSRDGAAFSKPEKLGSGSWQLNACPMDGGGIATSAMKTITAWRRGPSVFLAEPGKEEMQIGPGKDIAVAMSRGRIYAIWTDGTKIELWNDGKIEELSNNGSFPAIDGLPGGGALAAWEDNGVIVTRPVVP